MIPNKEIRLAAREWLSGLLCFSFLLAPVAGCPQRNGGNDNGDSTPRVGLFVNDNKDDSLRLAGRDADGNAIFVHGTLNGRGDLEEVDSIVVRTTAGEESFVTFESGRPVHAQGPNGSYAHVNYTTVTPTRLTGTVDIYDAATGAKESHAFDADLQESLAAIQQEVENATGRNLDTTQVVGDNTVETGKTLRNDVRVTIFSPLFAAFIVPLAAAVTVMTIVLGQILAVLYAVVVVALQAVLLTIFAPLFLIGAIFSDAVVRISVASPFEVFAIVPPSPVVVLVD